MSVLYSKAGTRILTACKATDARTIVAPSRSTARARTPSRGTNGSGRQKVVGSLRGVPKDDGERTLPTPSHSALRERQYLPILPPS